MASFKKFFKVFTRFYYAEYHLNLVIWYRWKLCEPWFFARSNSDNFSNFTNNFRSSNWNFTGDIIMGSSKNYTWGSFWNFTSTPFIISARNSFRSYASNSFNSRNLSKNSYRYSSSITREILPEMSQEFFQEIGQLFLQESCKAF